MSTTRTRLIDRAYELFGRGGFHAVGLDQIIAEVGVSKQTFYNHFESKDALILAVLEHRHAVESAVFGELIDRAAHGGDARAKLLAIFDALHAWVNRPEWRGCIFVTAAAEFPLKHDPAHQMALRHLQGTHGAVRTLAHAAGCADPDGLADRLSLLIEGAIAYRHVTHDDAAIATARDLARRLVLEQLDAPAADPIATLSASGA